MSLAEAPPEQRRIIVRDTVRKLVKRLPHYREILYRILREQRICEVLPKNERSRHGFSENCCWPWWKMRVHPRDHRQLEELELVLPCGRRGRAMYYYLIEPEAVAEALGIDYGSLERVRGEEPPRPAGGCTFPLSDDVFNDIVGYEKVKKWLRKMLCAKQPTHALLYGAPGTAKTEFIRAIYRDLSQKGYPVKLVYISSAGTTGQGLLEALINLPDAPTPSLLLIDEIDKVRDKKVLDILAHAMEHQQFTVNKSGVDELYERNVWVIATANDIARLPPHLLDRFGALKFYFPPYKKEEFLTVVPAMLVRQYGLDEDLAKYIAQRLADAGIMSVREARELAKVVETREDVDELIEMLKKRRSYWQWREHGWKKPMY